MLVGFVLCETFTTYNLLRSFAAVTLLHSHRWRHLVCIHICDIGVLSAEHAMHIPRIRRDRICLAASNLNDKITSECTKTRQFEIIFFLNNREIKGIVPSPPYQYYLREEDTLNFDLVHIPRIRRDRICLAASNLNDKITSECTKTCQFEINFF